MYLYIDKENLFSIIRQNGHPLYEDALRTLKRQLTTYFNFSKNSIKNDETLMALFKLLMDGVGNARDLSFLDEYVFPPRPITNDCMNTFSENKFSAIYLIDDENIDNLKNHGGVIVGTVGEELEVFDKLFLRNRDYDFHKELRIGGPLFTKWTDLSKFNLPLTDIVFVDRFILADKSLVEKNLIEYLKLLCEHSRCKINVVLYIDKARVAVEYAPLMTSIKTSISLVTGISPDVTIVEYTEQAGQVTLGEHDRTIFTNYLRIKSGDTYNYFLANGTVTTKGREITYNSLAKRDSHELAKGLISDLQKNIDFLKANNTGIHGDRSSNYLKIK